MRIWVVIDASIVLSAGVLTGLLCASFYHISGGI